MVFIPAGRYVTTKNLIIPPNTIVQGAGWKQTVLAPKPESEVPRPLLVGTALVGRNRPPYGSSDYVIIRDLQVDGGDPKVPRQGIAILGGSSHVTIEGCWLCNLGEYGIVAGDVREAEPYARGLHGIIIRNNHVDMTGAMLIEKDGTLTCAPIGIEVFPKGSAPYHAAPGVLIEGNTVIAGAYDGMICGIKVSNQSGARILNNHVTAPIASGEDRSGAITVTTSRDTVVSGNVIQGGKLGIGLTGDVANVPNGAPNENIQIVANSIRGAAQYGIYSSGGFSGLLIQGNSISIVCDGTQGVRLELFPALPDFTNFNFAFNRLRGGGIDLVLPPKEDGRGAPGARVICNHFEGTPLSRLNDDKEAFAPCNNPIDIRGSDILLEGNHIEGCVTFGIFLVGDRPCVRGNVVIDGNMNDKPSQSGVHIQGKGAEITGNIIINNPGRGHLKYGLFLDNAVDVKYADNLFCGMERGAIWPLIK